MATRSPVHYESSESRRLHNDVVAVAAVADQPEGPLEKDLLAIQTGQMRTVSSELHQSITAQNLALSRKVVNAARRAVRSGVPDRK